MECSYVISKKYTCCQVEPKWQEVMWLVYVLVWQCLVRWYTVAMCSSHSLSPKWAILALEHCRWTPDATWKNHSNNKSTTALNIEKNARTHLPFSKSRWTQLLWDTVSVFLFVSFCKLASVRSGTPPSATQPLPFMLYLVALVALCGLAFAGWLAAWVLAKDEGDEKMRQVFLGLSFTSTSTFPVADRLLNGSKHKLKGWHICI